MFRVWNDDGDDDDECDVVTNLYHLLPPSNIFHCLSEKMRAEHKTEQACGNYLSLTFKF